MPTTDLSKYINKEKLFLDRLKDRLTEIGDSDASWVYDTCFPMKLEVIEKDGKRYIEEPPEGIDSQNLMHEIVDVIDETKSEVDNFFSMLSGIDLYELDADYEFIWTNDYWYKIFKEGEWGELNKKTDTDPEYKTYSHKKLVEREIKKNEE